jgi:hypothetical protein
MNPIDKLKAADFASTFQCEELREPDARYIGYYGIFSDDGQLWSVDILAGIEVTNDGLQFRRGSSGLQYRHFHLIKNGIPVVAIAKYRPSCDGLIIGERKDKWLVCTPAYSVPVEIPKSVYIYFRNEEEGDEV